jgi:hypothetical protein
MDTSPPKESLMKRLLALAVVGLSPLFAAAAEPWQVVTTPSVAEAAAAFPAPPTAFRAIHWAFWSGQQEKDRILADIERTHQAGGGSYMINNARGMRPKYFTPKYLDLVKFVVAECKKRGMKVWIEGDAGYPDGFAGGMIAKDYPQLGMQALVADARYTVAGGQTLAMPLPQDTLGIVASPRGGAAGPEAAAEGRQQIPVPADGKLKFTGPSGTTTDVAVHSAAGVGHYSVVAGQTLTLSLPPGVTAIDAGPRGGGGGAGGGGGRGAGRGAAPGGPAPTVVPLPADGQLRWTAPAGDEAWDVTFVRHVLRSSPTRYTNREDNTADKDSLYGLIDYLNPEATRTYLHLIFDEYEKLVGDEFGKTVIGFRGDEPDYTGFMPWTPALLDAFKKQKGYDLQPYLPQFFTGQLSPEAARAKADYWDVWSGMFRDNFFKPIEEWCEARNMQYMMHLNHEEVMVSARGESMITNEGSFFRAMRYCGVPGVDNLNQINPGVVADFPKLAGSAAHLYGRALAWTEAGGGLGQSGKFVADYQLVRGINSLNMRGMNSVPPAPPPAGDAARLVDPAAATAMYVGRASYLLAVGRPAAQVALFHPTDSMWLGDLEADAATVKLTTQLMEHQIDFDHIDADTLASVCTLEGGGLKNLSGQVYRGVVVPTSTVIQKNVLERLRAFAAAGGKVVFVGRTPTTVVDKSFLHPEPGTPDLSFATIETTPDITPKVIAALPTPDVKLDADCPPIKYLHRSLGDGEVYFFFNESGQTQARTATLAGRGQVQVWDATAGAIRPVANLAANGTVAVPLTLAPQESRFVVIGPLPPGAKEAFPAVTDKPLATLDGDWSITLGETKAQSPLRPWQDLGAAAFSGTGTYQKTFTLTAAPAAGRHVYLDLGDARGAARVRVNGKDFDARPWAPFVWDVTDAVKAGDNMLDVQLQPSSSDGPGGGRGRGAGVPAAGPAGRGAPGGPAAPAGADAGGRGTGRGRGGAGVPGAPGGGAPAMAPRGLLGPVRLLAS